MNPMSLIVLFVLFAFIALCVRLIAGLLDGNRIDGYVRERGGRVLDRSWAPFGRGWFGEKDSRIYQVTYRDREGNVRRASCKTSMFSGVYFTDDVVVRPVAKAEPKPRTATGKRSVEELEAENRRLREEVARLRGQG